MARKTKQRDISVREAGRLGGQSTARTHGSDFYQKIGRMGGQARGRKKNQTTEEQ